MNSVRSGLIDDDNQMAEIAADDGRFDHLKGVASGRGNGNGPEEGSISIPHSASV